MTNANDFAATVAELEDRLGRMPNEREISDALQWTNSNAALIALGQEAEAAGLVRIVYDDNRERHYSRN